VPFANNNGIRIHFEVEGAGPPLVLQHGFAGHLERWRDLGYVEQLRANYRCVLIDARGHGQSDKPMDVEAYRLDLRYRDILCVLDELGIEQAHYWGYSMGGAIGTFAANAADGRFLSFVLGGTAPGARSEAETATARRMHEQLLQGKEAFLAALPESMRGPYAAIDAPALAVNMQAQLEARTYPALDAPPVPCLVYNGGSDPPAARGEALRVTAPPNVRYETIGELNHVECYQRSDLVLPVVLPFLHEVSVGPSK
jgi:pimeloyl-ACP methyl ester carboxylesterase